MNNTLFGVELCQCDEELREEELLDGVLFCVDCYGVIAYYPELEDSDEQ